MMKIWINLETDDVKWDLSSSPLSDDDLKGYVCVFEWGDTTAIPQRMNTVREAYFWGKYGMCFEEFIFPKMWTEKQGREWNVDEMKKHTAKVDAYRKR